MEINIRKFESFDQKNKTELKKEIEERLKKKFEEEKPGVTTVERDTWVQYAMGVFTEVMEMLPAILGGIN